MGEIAVGYYSSADCTAPAGLANVGTCYVGATVAKGAVYNERTGVLYGDDWVFETTRSTPTAPLAPTFASKTEDSVTLVTVD